MKQQRSDRISDYRFDDDRNVLRTVFETLRRRKKIVIACVAVLTLASVVGGSLLQKRYTAESIVILDTRHPEIQQNLAQSNLVSGSMSDPAVVRSEVALLNSTAYARAVIETSGLLDNPAFRAQIDDDAWQSRLKGTVEATVDRVATKIGRWLGLSTAVTAPASADSSQKLMEDAIASFSQHLSVFNDDRSYVIKLRYESADPAFAATVVNALAQTYVTEQLRFKQDQSRVALKWLNEQSDILGKKVFADEREVADFERQHNLDTVTGSSISEQRMADLNGQLASAIVDRAQKEVTLARLKGSQVAALEIDVARLREQAIRNQVHDLQGELNGMNIARVQLREMQRKASVERDLYEKLLQRSQQVESEAQSQQSDARFLAAEVPIKPSFPNKTLLAGLGFFTSAGLGLWLALVIDRLDETIRTPGDAARITGVPTMGVIPRVGGGRQALAALTDRPMSTYSEAISKVLLALRSVDHQSPHKVIVVTSALAGEGKSLIAASMARAAAARGMRTLLIDCDFRRPAVSQLFSGKAEASLSGMFEANLTDTRAAAAKEEATGLFYLPAGKVGSSPQQILGSPWMETVLANARVEYDLVVLDTPPLLAVWDALLLSRIAESTLIAVRWGKTPQRAVRDAVELLRTYGTLPVGTVLSLVEWRKYRRYESGGFYYGPKAGRRLLTENTY
nr:AAA family ATPase [uncultured Rhodopila sp.]